jgi:hypothetical protein
MSSAYLRYQAKEIWRLRECMERMKPKALAMDKGDFPRAEASPVIWCCAISPNSAKAKNIRLGWWPEVVGGFSGAAGGRSFRTTLA